MSENMFKFPKVENLVIGIFIILSLNIIINYLNIEIYYEFSSDQVDTIFFLNQNIPENSTILVPDLKEKNYLYDLLTKHELMFLDNTKIGVYDIYRGILISMNKEYLVIDIITINPKYLSQFQDYDRFETIFENDQNIVFKFHD